MMARESGRRRRPSPLARRINFTAVEAAVDPPAKSEGGRRKVNMRKVVYGAIHVLSTWCRVTEDCDERLVAVHDALYVKFRESAVS